MSSSRARAILPLPTETIAQIKSSVTITSLNEVIAELLKNSLDASSTRVDITLDYTRGNCSVEDDGYGIPPSEFDGDGGLAKQYHSSKQSSSDPSYGSRGLFLHSLSTLSLVSITSRHHMHRSQNSLTLSRSQPVVRQCPAPQYLYLSSYKHGTRVIVRDLFGNMPVRVKQRALSMEGYQKYSRDWEELRKETTRLLLAWPKRVSVSILDIPSGNKIRFVVHQSPARGIHDLHTEQISHICNSLSQAGLIPSPDKSLWVPVAASTERLSLNGAISLAPAPTKNIQFISLGIYPLSSKNGSNILFDEINRLFANSSFGKIEEPVELGDAERERRSKDRRYKSDMYTNKEMHGVKKGIDKWPMFSINIRVSGVETGGHNNMDAIMTDHNPLLNSLVDILCAVVTEFLKNHHFSTYSASEKNRQRQLLENVNTRLHLSDSDASAGGVQVLKQDRPIPTRTPSPFDQWSRIKAGRPTSKTQHSSLLSSMKSSEDTNAASPRIVSKSGRLVRPPFTDIVETQSRNTESPSLNQSDVQDTADQVITWVDPVTKEPCLINSRTGHVVHSDRSDGQNPPKEYASRQSSIARIRKTIKNVTPEPSPWVRDILVNWDNPIFRPAEVPIPRVFLDTGDAESQSLLHGYQLQCSHLDIERAFQSSSAGLSTRLSKNGLRQAEIISQVDKKFILLKMPESAAHSSNDTSNQILVLVDQHAADERCRLEDLMTDLFERPDAEGPFESSNMKSSGVITRSLAKPLTFEIPTSEIQLLQRHHKHFADWGIVFKIPKASADSHLEKQTVVVSSLPPAISERCRLEPRLLVELLRAEAWKCNESNSRKNEYDLGRTETEKGKHPWLKKIHDCPQGILDMLNSRSCRSAIMFNDELSHEQCRILLQRLADCAFPFQCAHGRPSMIPLLDINSLTQQRMGRQTAEYDDYRTAFRAWKQHRDTPS